VISGSAIVQLTGGPDSRRRIAEFVAAMKAATARAVR
jgi:hypothetical protein